MARLARRKGDAVTIRGVADRAGVSIMTVSNVINGTGKVGEATRAVVRRAIADLGYIPNVAARRLATAGATSIGLVYGNAQTPFLDAILVGALDATAARGLQLMVRDGEGRSPEEAEAIATGLIRSGANALLLIPPFAELLSGSLFLESIGVPVAAIATGCSLPDMMTVRIDNRAAARSITELLIAQGHRRIGFVTGPMTHTDSVERMHGHLAALAAHDVPQSPDLLLAGDFTFASGLAAGDALLALSQPPTAIVASNDDMAAGIVSTAHRRGLRLPADLAVTGFDDTQIATRIWPPLTVIRQPVGHMAHRATELLIEALRHPGGFPKDELLDYSLIERESTGVRAISPT